jgi:hypothetical protein
MSDETANLRRSIQDLEDDLERARANLSVVLDGILVDADEHGAIEDALKDLAWEIHQALKTFKRQLTHEAAQ